MGWQIAIDGPASSGKSTIANALSKKINFSHLDTGAMYRAITLKALNLKIDLSKESEYSFLSQTDIAFDKDEIFLDGKNVTNDIRTVEVTKNVSLVSTFESVRSKLVKLQRNFAKSNNIVMDGRDIGTVVLPNANLKIYLDATVEERAKRRHLERIKTNNLDISLDETIKELAERDYKDSNRLISPLKQAEDAIKINTTNLNINEVLTEVIRLVIERGFIMENEKDLLVTEEDGEEQEVEDTKSLEEKVSEPVEDAPLPLLKNLQQAEGTVTKITKAMQGKSNKLIEEKAIFMFENGQEGMLSISDTSLKDNESLYDFFEEGEKYNVVIKKTLPNNKVIVSTKLVEKRKELSTYEEIIKEHGVLNAKVIKKIPDGLLLKHNDFSCLLPTSQIDINVEEFDKLVGESLEVAPIRVDYTRIRLIVSYNVAKSIKYRAEKEKFFEKVKVGDTLEGIIKSIKDYGAFVELEPGVEGLLHISEVAHTHININDCLTVGDKITVQVIKVENNQIGLSRKAILPDMWNEFSEKNKVDDLITVKVSEINKAGVVVSINGDVSGFIPKSEFSWERDAFISDYIKVGDPLEIKILEIDPKKRRIILTRKQCQENPWECFKHKQGDKVKGTVAAVLKDGIKITIDGITGYASKRSLSDSNLGNYKVGSEIEVTIRMIDTNEMKLILTTQEQRDYMPTAKGTDKEVTKALKEQTKVLNTFGDLADLDKWQK